MGSFERMVGWHGGYILPRPSNPLATEYMASFVRVLRVLFSVVKETFSSAFYLVGSTELSDFGHIKVPSDRKGGGTHT